MHLLISNCFLHIWGLNCMISQNMMQYFCWRKVNCLWINFCFTLLAYCHSRLIVNWKLVRTDSLWPLCNNFYALFSIRFMKILLIFLYQKVKVWVELLSVPWKYDFFPQISSSICWSVKRRYAIIRSNNVITEDFNFKSLPPLSTPQKSYSAGYSELTALFLWDDSVLKIIWKVN